MEYKFVGDPKLRERLEKARNQNKTKIKKDNSTTSNFDGEETLKKSLEKKKIKKNKKFETLKSKKKKE